jgi:lipopolysaccharide assembly outer membrane protein LptD (OstA)
MVFDYKTIYPINGWFIDGEHDTLHAEHECKEAIKSKAKLIVLHDADMSEVMQGIFSSSKNGKNYELYRVDGTRILYAVRK